MRKVIIALGGNALMEPGEEGTEEQQRENVEKTLRKLKPILDKKKAVLTHGNGPQVGDLLIKQEKTDSETSNLKLDTCVAMTQGQIGYYIQQMTDDQTVSIVTQVEVDPEDPAFDDPKKPIGPYYEERPNKDWAMKEKKEGWRRVVPSPEPKRVVEIEEIKELLNQGYNVIACGGGGVPVKNTEKGYEGIEAVIDKDKASSLLAESLNADEMYLLTNVPYVYKNYGEENQEKIKEIHSNELKELMEKGEFEEGSMKPKIEASLRFLSKGGEKVVITSIENAGEIEDGIGTMIRR